MINTRYADNQIGAELIPPPSPLVVRREEELPNSGGGKCLTLP